MEQSILPDLKKPGLGRQREVTSSTGVKSNVSDAQSQKMGAAAISKTLGGNYRETAKDIKPKIDVPSPISKPAGTPIVATRPDVPFSTNRPNIQQNAAELDRQTAARTAGQKAAISATGPQAGLSSSQVPRSTPRQIGDTGIRKPVAPFRSSLSDTGIRKTASPGVSPLSTSPSLNAATGSAIPNDNQRRAGMTSLQVRDAMYGRSMDRKPVLGDSGVRKSIGGSNTQRKPYSNTEQDAARSLGVKTQDDTVKSTPQAQARAAGPQTYQSDKESAAERAYKSIGSAAGGGNYAAAQTRISNTVKRTASGDIPPTAQSQGDSDRTGSVIRTNIERIKSRTGQNKPFDTSYKAKAGTTPRDAALDQPASQSPMAKAIERKDAATDAADAAKRADMRGATGNPNIAPAKIGASKKLDFKQAYAAARKAGQTGFEWEGKKYNTKMKGETATKRKQVLSRNVTRTAGRKARTGNQLNEMSLKEKVMTLVREKLDGTV